jgi:aspartyl-tRNA(Asn)/glutamyl-tRNA(Gln) amidotransferase subunit A
MRAATSAHGIIRICDAAAYHRQYLLTKAEQYKPNEGSGPEVSQVRTTVEAGSLITAAQYLRCQQVRRIFIREMLELFNDLDVLLAPPVKARDSQGVPYTLGIRAHFNILGFPAISVPCGFSSGSPAGLPIGLHICATPFQDATVLTVAHAYESATEWHKKRPPIS